MPTVKQVQVSHDIRVKTSTGKEVWLKAGTVIKTNKKGKVVAPYAMQIKNKKDKFNVFPETVMACTPDDIRKHILTVQVDVPIEEPTEVHPPGET